MESWCLVGKYNNGKWLPLSIHLRDTMEVMKYLLQSWVSESQIAASHMTEEDFKKAAILVAGLHDVGKSTAYFQGLITKQCAVLADQLDAEGFVLCRDDMYWGRTPHAHAGQWILQYHFDIPENFADVIGAHHGVPAPEPGINGTKNMLKVWSVNFFGREKDQNQEKLWEQVWEDILNNALQAAGMSEIKEIPDIPVEAQVNLSALLSMADWIASNEFYFPLFDLNYTGMETDWNARSREGWRKLNFPQSWDAEVKRMGEEIFDERFGFLPNDLQRAVFQAAGSMNYPGIMIMEAQMGIGKTEAALAAAEVLAGKFHSKGIFFGLPTQATCNGIYDRLYRWAAMVSEDTLNAIKLAHGGAMYDPEYLSQVLEGRARVEEDNVEEGLLVHPWFNGNKKALLADFVIGTVDQLLMASLKKSIL